MISRQMEQWLMAMAVLHGLFLISDIASPMVQMFQGIVKFPWLQTTIKALIQVLISLGNFL
jgi:hypothetical protein